MDKLAATIVGKSKQVLGLTFLTTLLALCCLTRMDFNADVMSFLTEGNKRGSDFVGVMDKYKTADPITVLLKRSGGFDHKEGLLVLLDARTRVEAVEGVGGVACMIPPKNPVTQAPIDEALIQALPQFLIDRMLAGPQRDLLMNEAGDATLMMVIPEGDGIAVAGRVARVDWPAGVEATLVGNPVVFASVIGMLGWFLLAIPPTVIILLLGVFALTLGSRKLAALSILPAVLGSIWTFGFIFGLGYRVDIVTVIVPIFVIVMGSADGLHFVSHLQEHAKTEEDAVQRTAGALREVGVPMILTTISTAAGFLSLLATDIGPIRQLGLFVAIGITFAGVVSFFSLPALLSRIEIPPQKNRGARDKLTDALTWASKKPAIAGVFVLVMMAFAAVYVPKLAVNPDQLFFFKDDNPVRESFEEVNELFGGATPLMGEFALDRSLPLEPQLAALRESSAELTALSGVKRVFSILDLVDQAPAPMRAGLLSGEIDSPIGSMVSEDGIRFVLMPGTFTSEELASWIEYADTHDEVRVLTGLPVLFDEMSRLVLRAQMSSLGLAFGLVALMLLVAYRRVLPTLAALLPIALTCGVLLGFLSFSGIQLNLLTAVISSIVIGVGIDYAIHLMAAIEHARKHGADYVRRGIAAAGRPIVANAVGIAVGMSALFMSPLRPHGQIAAIMWVSMLTSAAAALLIIPALSSRR